MRKSWRSLSQEYYTLVLLLLLFLMEVVTGKIYVHVTQDDDLN